MLDFAQDVEPNSRLSCQIKVTEDLDGLVVRTPKSPNIRFARARKSHLRLSWPAFVGRDN